MIFSLVSCSDKVWLDVDGFLLSAKSVRAQEFGLVTDVDNDEEEVEFGIGKDSDFP